MWLWKEDSIPVLGGEGGGNLNEPFQFRVGKPNKRETLEFLRTTQWDEKMLQFL